MQQVTDLPAAFGAYRQIGGVLEFASFDGSDGSEADCLAAIRAAIPAEFGFDAGALRELGSRAIGLPEFLGDWCNPASGRLIRVGKWYGPNDTEYDSPELVSLEGIPGEGGVYFPPDPGSGGQFAYAFQCPPGSLKASPLDVQGLFDAVYGFLLPAGEEAEIRDWSSPQLDAVSDWFASGVDGWGGVPLHHLPERLRAAESGCGLIRLLMEWPTARLRRGEGHEALQDCQHPA